MWCPRRKSNNSTSSSLFGKSAWGRNRTFPQRWPTFGYPRDGSDQYLAFVLQECGKARIFTPARTRNLEAFDSPYLRLERIDDELSSNVTGDRDRSGRHQPGGVRLDLSDADVEGCIGTETMGSRQSGVQHS